MRLTKAAEENERRDAEAKEGRAREIEMGRKCAEAEARRDEAEATREAAEAAAAAEHGRVVDVMNESIAEAMAGSTRVASLERDLREARLEVEELKGMVAAQESVHGSSRVKHLAAVKQLEAERDGFKKQVDELEARVREAGAAEAEARRVREGLEAGLKRAEMEMEEVRERERALKGMVEEGAVAAMDLNLKLAAGEDEVREMRERLAHAEAAADVEVRRGERGRARASEASEASEAKGAPPPPEHTQERTDTQAHTDTLTH